MTATWTCLVVMLALATPAAADPNPRAARHADRAIKYYNMGHFDQAIEEYEKAYEIDPDPLLLYNLAQAHRQKGDPERAIFFYRRYLQMAPEATDRPQVEKKIADLERQQKAASIQPASGVVPATPPAATAASPPPAGPQAPPQVALASPPAATAVLPEPSVTAEEPEPAAGASLRVAVSGGAALPHFSGVTLDAPVLGNIRGTVAAALPAGPGEIDLGGSLALVPVPYQPVGSTSQKMSYLMGVFGVAGYRQPLSDAFSLGAEVDLGLGLWSGLDRGNPFTTGHDGTSGPLPLPTARLAAAALYHLSRPLWLWAGPGYEIALPVSNGLKENVTSIHLFELTAGLTVQFL